MDRRWLWFATVFLLVCGLGYLGWEFRRARGFEAALEGSVEELRAGRFEAARTALRALETQRPGNPSVSYYLGLCERELGNPEAALEVWSKVGTSEEFGARAGLAAGQVRVDLGRWAEAEQTWETALVQASGHELLSAMIRERLVQLYGAMGRRWETRPLIEEVWRVATRPPPGQEWAELSQPRDLLRQSCIVDLEPPPVTQWRAQLERAHEQAPQDNRVWLGLAALAIEEGRLDEADDWLGPCLERRPDDPAVRRVQWHLALERGDLATALEALRYFNNNHITSNEILAARAWFDAQRGDLDAARSALRDILEREPAHLEALERIAELSARAGDRVEAAAWRERKAKLDRIMNRYQAGYYAADVRTQGPQMAEWAEALGRLFEAEAWWTLVARDRGQDEASRTALLRLRSKRREWEAVAEAGPSVSELIAVLEAASVGKPAREAIRQSDHVVFVDGAESAGLDFQHDPGRTADRQLPETMSGGVALLDFDGDGWLDVYVVQGGPFPPRPDQRGGDRLFRNRGDGTFEDVSVSSGIADLVRGYGHGVAVGDFDNDGHPDVFLTRWRSCQLLRNRGDGTFEDVTAEVGLDDPYGWPTSAAFADFDGDGNLDLYVAHYVDWDTSHPVRCPREDGTYSYCHPLAAPAIQDRLYRNVEGRFVDVSAEAGILVAEPGRGLGVLAADLDHDGRIDIYVANDATANFYFRNLGDGTFAEVAHESGLAANAQGGYQAGMGIACGDFNGDGLLDLAVTNFFGEGTTYYENLGDGLFSDRSAAVGLLSATRSLLGFGTAWIDVDNDGYLDLLTVNGHIDDHRPRFPYAMPIQLLMGHPTGRLERIGDVNIPPWNQPRLGRGLAVGDLDGDGRLDALALCQGEPPVLLSNQTEGGHYLLLELEGTDSNRDAVGALVTVYAGSRRLVATRFGGGSYQSSASPRLHFGLGSEARIEAVEIDWPSGLRERYEGLEIDRLHQIREGSGDARAEPGAP